MNFLTLLNKQFLFWSIMIGVGCWLVQSPTQAVSTSNLRSPDQQHGRKSTAAAPSRSPEIVSQAESQLSFSVHQLASEITVKVLAGDTWGSGILIQQQGPVYTVVTNEHVLVAGDQHRIQTPDGRIYGAWVVRVDRFEGNDLGLLQFSSDRRYRTATLGNAASLTIGDDLVASGFPVEANTSLARGLVITTGRVSLLPSRIIQQGYQIGYTNPIQKGMSGGPVLNQQGRVVGINGRHAYPLWGDPFVFEDGSRPCPALQQRMVQLSWAIPTERFVQLAPQFAPLVVQSGSGHPSTSAPLCQQAAEISPPPKLERQLPIVSPAQPLSSQFLW
jgi:S1-C subfamily serine protease